MVKPLFGQKSSNRVGPRLQEALRWWSRTLGKDLSETWTWVESPGSICHLFVDAASTPPRCAAVLAIDGTVLYTDVRPSSQIMGQLKPRCDGQITSACVPVLCLACRFAL